VKEYILAKGNREATEVLRDYVKYLHKVGYTIHRQSKFVHTQDIGRLDAKRHRLRRRRVLPIDRANRKGKQPTRVAV